jgi:anthranilate/para-aminobenzoate synthase component II
MLLLIDNYDSFAYNLARYFERLGVSTHVVRNDAIDVAGVRSCGRPRSSCHQGRTPREAGASLDIVRAVYAELPLLGVCLGHQVIAERRRANRAGRVAGSRANVAVVQTAPDYLPVCHRRLRRPLPSLVVEPATLPAELRATAWTEDGC